MITKLVIVGEFALVALIGDAVSDSLQEFILLGAAGTVAVTAWHKIVRPLLALLQAAIAAHRLFPKLMDEQSRIREQQAEGNERLRVVENGLSGLLRELGVHVREDEG